MFKYPMKLTADGEGWLATFELARRLGTRPQEVNRIVDLHHATKIDTLAAAFHALGKNLTVNIV